MAANATARMLLAMALPEQRFRNRGGSDRAPACTYTHNADNAGWFAIASGIVLCRCFAVDPPPSEKTDEARDFFGMPAHGYAAGEDAGLPTPRIRRARGDGDTAQPREGTQYKVQMTDE